MALFAFALPGGIGPDRPSTGLFQLSQLERSVAVGGRGKLENSPFCRNTAFHEFQRSTAERVAMF